MKRTLSPEEKAEASELASMWESSKFSSATVQISVRDETDDEGRPTYEFVIKGLGRLPKLTAGRSPESSARESTGQMTAR